MEWCKKRCKRCTFSFLKCFRDFFQYSVPRPIYKKNLNDSPTFLGSNPRVVSIFWVELGVDYVPKLIGTHKIDELAFKIFPFLIY